MCPYKFVEVEWLDANSGGGWEQMHELPEVAMVHTRGWLVKQDLEGIVVSGTWSPKDPEKGDKEQFNQSIAIPMGMVVNLREISCE